MSSVETIPPATHTMRPQSSPANLLAKTDSLALVFAFYVLCMLALAVLHPVLEWPDAETHITEACQGDSVFPPKELLAAVGQDLCAFSFLTPVAEFRFFSDQSLNSDLHSLNPIWSYIVLSLLGVAGMFALIAASQNRDVLGHPFIFVPPLAFSFANINLEVFGLFLVVGGWFLFRRRPRLAIFLAVLATAIDRSHVCSVLTLSLIHFFQSRKHSLLLPLFVGGIALLYVARLAGLLDFVDLLAAAFDSFSILGVSGNDILANADVGGRGYAALLASAAGLYGAMSFRPVLWPLYYALFFTLLFIGWLRSSGDEKRVLMIAFTAAISVLILLPPLSQARYYPILVISMWSMVIRGGNWFGVSPMTLQALFFAWTVTSVVSINLSNVAQG
jgi:hypothetical protein